MLSDVAELERPADSLPDGWRSSRLGDVARLGGGTTPARGEAGYWENASVPWATPSDITSLPTGVNTIASTESMVSDRALAECSLPLNPPGTVLMTSRATIGFAAINTVPMTTNQGFITFTAGRDLDPAFLLQWLIAQRPNLRAAAGGSTFKELSRGTAKLLPIDLPPLDEQRRIAEVLRSVDEAIATSDLALTQARMVRQSAINELLSPTGGSVEIDRLRCRLSDVLSIAHGFPFKSEYFTSNRDDPILLTPGNFSVEKTLYFGERTKHYSGPIPDGYVLEDGSLVVVMTDLTQDMAILGNAVEVSGNGVVLHNQRIGRVSLLRPDLITKGYARLLLNSDPVQWRIKSTASGSTVRHTAPSRILECEVQLPPLEEQGRIVAIAKSLDDIVVAEERRRSDDEVTGPLSHLRGLKDIIARDLLSGRVRVTAR